MNMNPKGKKMICPQPPQSSSAHPKAQRNLTTASSPSKACFHVSTSRPNRSH